MTATDNDSTLLVDSGPSKGAYTDFDILAVLVPQKERSTAQMRRQSIRTGVAAISVFEETFGV
jgi:hypothetical protein